MFFGARGSRGLVFSGRGWSDGRADAGNALPVAGLCDLDVSAHDFEGETMENAVVGENAQAAGFERHVDAVGRDVERAFAEFLQK